MEELGHYAIDFSHSIYLNKDGFFAVYAISVEEAQEVHRFGEKFVYTCKSWIICVFRQPDTLKMLSFGVVRREFMISENEELLKRLPEHLRPFKLDF
jgi:hypothetical protein